MIGPLSNWDGLPDRKCLANSPEGKGIVIGDITSQLFSNILLNIYDQWVKRILKVRHYGHYVDDMYHMHQSKQFLLDAIPKIEEFLEKEVHVKVNHDKWRLLSAYNANQYLGAYIRPYYLVPRQRTIDKFCRVMKEIEYFLVFNDPTPDELLNIRARINSYCGLLSHYKSFKLLKKYLDRPAFYFYFTFDRGFSKAILRPQFGGKPVPYEWYDPPLFVRHSNSAELPRNWFKQFKMPLDMSVEERNALQFLADNLLI
jgi:hypothetical protein